MQLKSNLACKVVYATQQRVRNGRKKKKKKRTGSDKALIVRIDGLGWLSQAKSSIELELHDKISVLEIKFS